MAEFIEILQGIGAFGLAMAIIWAFLFRKVVPEQTYLEQKELTKQALDRVEDLTATVKHSNDIWDSVLEVLKKDKSWDG